MSNKLFVGGLSWGTDDNSLRQTFEAHGDVKEATVITDRDSGRSRGFGFVTMADAESAADAMKALDGTSLDGRNIRVNEAHDKRGGGRSSGGNRRSGGYR